MPNSDLEELDARVLVFQSVKWPRKPVRKLSSSGTGHGASLNPICLLALAVNSRNTRSRSLSSSSGREAGGRRRRCTGVEAERAKDVGVRGSKLRNGPHLRLRERGSRGAILLVLRAPPPPVAVEIFVVARPSRGSPPSKSSMNPSSEEAW